MKNSEKFQTAEGRARAFSSYCDGGAERGAFKRCLAGRCIECVLKWLDLEAEEEKIEDCPYCGGKCYAEDDDGRHRVFCHKDMSCRYSSGTYTTEHEAIAAHNHFAHSVMEAGKKEAK